MAIPPTALVPNKPRTWEGWEDAAVPPDRLADPKLGPYIKGVRDEVRNGTLLSEAFRQQGERAKFRKAIDAAKKVRGQLAAQSSTESASQSARDHSH